MENPVSDRRTSGHAAKEKWSKKWESLESHCKYARRSNLNSDNMELVILEGG